MIETKAPGKLYLAGEYAVVEPGNPAVLISVDKFIKVELKRDDNGGSITTFDESPILWKREDNRLVLDRRDNRLSYVISSIRTVEKYARELGKELGFYHVKIESQMESSDGKKYGLGSSAAVTVAMVKALCQYYKIPLTNEKLFKLSNLAQLDINSNGSGGDIAASVYGGMISYYSFDRKWVIENYKEASISQILNYPWPYLKIERLEIPQGFNLKIGWTKNPASTARLVDEMEEEKDLEYLAYEDFLIKSRETVENLIFGIKNNTIERVHHSISENRKLLSDLGKNLGVCIETSILTKLCDLAESNGGFAKSSGAGGGDCGIALFPNERQAMKTVEEWKINDIENLPLNIYQGEKDDAK